MSITKTLSNGEIIDVTEELAVIERSRLKKLNNGQGAYEITTKVDGKNKKHVIKVDDRGFFHKNRHQRRAFEKEHKMKAKQAVWNKLKEKLENGTIKLPE